MGADQTKYIFFKLIKNKFVLTGLIFFIWLLFFDKNNLLQRADAVENLNQLRKDKIYYKERIDQARQRINELKTDKKSLEKFAREQYLMKKEDEDIFIVVEQED
jgi:cell division protein FtsB